MQIIRNSTIYLGSSILNKAIPFLLLPILTKYLSPSEYGVVSIFQIFISLFTAVVGMAINTNVSKNFYSYGRIRMALLIGNILKVLALSTLVVFTITYTTTIFFEEVFSLPKNWVRAIPVLSAMFMVNTINLTVLRMKGEAITYGIFEVSSTLVNMGVSIVMLVLYNYGWESRAIGISSSYLIFFFAGLYLLNKRKYIDHKFDKHETKAVLKLSLPLIPHALGGIVIAVSDRLFIEKMISLQAVGVYTVGYMFGMVVMLFTDAFIKAWNPWFFKTLAKPTIKKKHRVVQYTYIYLVLVLVLAFGVTLMGKLMLPYFVEPEYFEASKFIFWVALGYVFFGAYQIFFPYLVHIGKTSFLATSTVVSAIVNLVMNYFLIKKYGAIGAAYATVIAYVLSCILVFWYQKKQFEMPWTANPLKASFHENG